VKVPGLTQLFLPKFWSGFDLQKTPRSLIFFRLVSRLKSAQTGLTMIEVLIVVAILALLLISLSLTINLQLMRSRDVQRKAHLEKLKVAFENYYNDNACYPPTDIFFNGGTAPDPAICDQPLPALQPYLDKVPCDPDTKIPYSYFEVDGGQICDGYRLYTQLEDENDKGIASVGCSKTGCGDLSDYNYGVSVGGELAIGDGIIEEAQPTIPPGMPTGQLGTYACSPNSDPSFNNGDPYCRPYDFPANHGCGASTSTPQECDPYCYVGSPIICSD
jgi:prepilin-type N-terminal cleavage/methylation domain-containing protein